VGGIAPDNAAPVAALGVHGLAAIRAVWERGEARRLLAALGA
jgi:thiamine monophosphate synthase